MARYQTAVAEPSSTAVADTAETLSTAVAETAVAEPLSTAVAEKASDTEATPDCHMKGELPNLKPHAPAIAIELCIGDDAMHDDEATPSVASATPSVVSKIVLYRSVSPRYSTFFSCNETNR